jgi:hypothetical protein
MRVTAGDEDHALGILNAVDHAMSKETSVPGDEYDVAYHHARDFDVMDEKNVRRPDGRKHASSRHPQSSFADSLKQDRNQLGGDIIHPC